MPRIRVLKPFMFTFPSYGKRGLPREQQFIPGEHEISDEIANHPWIKDDLADGKIESPAQAAIRTEIEKKQAEEKAAEARAANERAEAAMAKLRANQAREMEAANADLALLNTPVDKLPKIGGTGGVSGGADADVPVNVLRARQNQKK